MAPRAFRRRDTGAALHQPTLDRQTDPDSAGQKRCKCCNGQVAREAIGEACDLWLDLLDAARSKAGARIGIADGIEHGRGVRSWRQHDRAGPGGDGSWQEDAGLADRVDAGHDARTDAVDALHPLRLIHQHGTDRNLEVAEIELVADVHAQAWQKAPLHHHAMVGQRGGDGHWWIQGHLADQRPGILHPLQGNGEAARVACVVQDVAGDQAAHADRGTRRACRG